MGDTYTIYDVIYNLFKIEKYLAGHAAAAMFLPTGGHTAAQAAAMGSLQVVEILWSMCIFTFADCITVLQYMYLSLIRKVCAITQ